ncbi:MAG: hypothetical protein Q8M09_03770 [Pseudomonadota bacterium]|nr:hypothetical protein [Pseudomonadota bacterium]MDP1903355.1 hypothetical protein [Pseudomonadota bacterium]MDP2352325.1 hypothetical protein [Pseudomonadota bacterium]
MRLALLALLFLAACAGQPGASAPPERGRLVLLAALAIPAESASVRLQYGHPVARNGVREYDPFCVFEIDTVSDSPQTVRPDVFRITRIGHSIGGIADTVAAPPVFAPMRVGLFDDDRPSHIYYKTLFWLHSETQPGARLLTCMSNQNMPGVYPFMRHLTLEEMRAALGADFRLEVR